MKLSLGYTTFPTKAEAKKVVLYLLQEELIACANIIDGVESYFPWEDGIQQANETVVIFKTRQKNEDKIIRAIKDFHSYEIPCIVFTPLDYGNPDFMKWVDENC
jgi:periplasmic divalent cation tolerance protein